ncbi:MAG: hypothetical protein WBW92_07055 [Rhodanobacteraceae bacterium]
MIRKRQAVLATALITVIAGTAAVHAAAPVLYSQASTQAPNGTPSGGPYVPPGTLFDNEQGNGTTSLVSQDSTGTFTARSADDFSIPAGSCATGVFDITQIRVQMVQQDAAAQAFAVDLFDDNGSGTAPTAGINPIATYPESSQTSLGAFGATTSIFEAAFDTTGLQLNADTVYWVSGYGADANTNSAGFNNFFAASNGAAGTTANGVTIAPDAGAPTWTDSGSLISSAPLAYSFAIDGTCAAPAIAPSANVPTLGKSALLLLGLLSGLAALVMMRRRRVQQA